MSSPVQSASVYFNDDEEVALAIELLDALPSYSGYEFNPQAIIKAVNFLYNLDYEKSFHILQLYNNNNSLNFMDELKLYAVTRILFVFKPVEEPLFFEFLEDPNLKIPEQPFSLFPFHIHQGIPFLLGKGGCIFGEYTSLAHIEAQPHLFELRDAPLIPDNDPLASVDELLKSQAMQEQIISDPDPEMPSRLRLQALNAVANVYPISKQDLDELLSSATHEESWQKHKQAFAALHIVWNIANNKYDCV
jgi:hypothetical protein